MAKFRKKPVVIEAIQYNGHNSADIHEFCGNVALQPVLPIGVMPYMEIITLEGKMKAIPSDWIIKGVNGEYYPCKPDIFDKTYDLVGCENMPVINLSFGKALEAAKRGDKIAREGWNGKGMFVYYVPANEYKTTTEIAKKEFGETVKYNAYLAIKNVNGSVSTWVPSINDCLADDWMIVR